MKIIVLVFALLTATPAALAVSAAPAGPLDGPGTPIPLQLANDWRIETVGLFGGSSGPGIALDSQGIPRILYCPPGDVEYATRTPSGWASEHVIYTIFAGGCGELALGPGGVPHITTATAKDVLKEMYGARVNGTWNLSPYPGGLLGAVNSRGEPQVVSYWNLTPGQFSFRYLTLANGTWVHEDVETFAATSWFGSAWASVALDSGNQPKVLYYDSVRGDVRYALRDSSGWRVEVVEHIGNIQYVGRHGSLALAPDDTPRAVYWADVDYASNRGSLRYAVRSSASWTLQTLEGPPGMRGRFPTIAVDPSGAVHVTAIDWDVLNPANYSFLADLRFATLASGSWSWETVYAGYQYVRSPTDYQVRLPDFPDMAVDRCGNPHIAFYLNWITGLNTSQRGVYYATKGEPCSGSSRSASLHVEPRTLNLKSHGQWVSARITVENATSSDIDPASLALNGVPAARVEVLDNATLNAKFDRQAFAATVQPGESVVVTLTGLWSDGGAFTATDVIRVIDPGGGHEKP